MLYIKLFIFVELAVLVPFFIFTSSKTSASCMFLFFAKVMESG